MSLGPEDLRALPWGSDAVLMLGTGEGPLPHVRGGTVLGADVLPLEPWDQPSPGAGCGARGSSLKLFSARTVRTPDRRLCEHSAFPIGSAEVSPAASLTLVVTG